MLFPATQISPTSPSGAGVLVSGLTILASTPSRGCPPLTSSSTSLGGESAEAISTTPAFSDWRVIRTVRRPDPVTARVFSASP